jgi:nitroreductase
MDAGDAKHSALVDEVLRSRRTVRAFEVDEVPIQTVIDLLDVARYAPSTFNTQPWRVHVLLGDAKRELSAALTQAHQAATSSAHAAIPHAASQEIRARQQDFFARYYATIGIDPNDATARQQQTARNYAFFDAPVGLIFTIDSSLTHHSWLDLGLFIQNFMIAAHARGLATIAQVSFVRYEPVIRAVLGLPDGERVACGMSMGAPDRSSDLNRMSMPREPISGFVTWHGTGGSENHPGGTAQTG